jgi:N-acetyltransferase
MVWPILPPGRIGRGFRLVGPSTRTVVLVLSPFVLEGQLVRLEPLTADHVDALAAAAVEDRARYGYTWVPEGVDETSRYVLEALTQQEAGRSLPWAARRLADDRIVGTTRFWDMQVFSWPPPWPPGVGHGPEPSDDRPPSVLEIGSTWYAASAQRTGINREAKLLQLTQAFQAWHVLRVVFTTDARNSTSRRAIERLGASFEGVRRLHSPARDGTIRDSAYYSITAPEWPAVRSRLLQGQR